MMSAGSLLPAAQADTSSTPRLPANALALGNGLTLKIDGENLVIEDENKDKNMSRSCCRVPVIGRDRQSSIALYDTLWADIGDASITITFAHHVSKSTLRPGSLTFPFCEEDRGAVEKWVEQLYDAAYGESQREKRLKVLVNPFGGQGNAVKLFEKEARPLLEAAHCVLDVQITERKEHAIEIAKELDIEAFDAVVGCSGDGIPHEVFNGLGMRKDAAVALKSVAVCNIPCGSGCAMSWNLTGSGDVGPATLAIIKSVRRPIDLVSITQGNRRLLSFCSQSFGLVAEVDLGTEDLRWMGDARFTYGFIQRIWGKTVYPCDVAVKVAMDDKSLIREHYRRGGVTDARGESKEEELPALVYGDINSELPKDWELVHHPTMGNFYAGNMAWMSAGANFFPASLPHENMFDLICIDGTLGRLDAVRTLLAVETGGHFEMPHVLYRKVLGYRIIPHKREGVTEEYISIDGERIPFAPFQAEVHGGLGTVLAKRDFYEAPGV